MTASSSREIPDCYLKVLLDGTGAQDCLDMWKKPPTMREGVHMVTRDLPGYGRCPLAGAAAAAACRCSGVWWGGHGKERSFQVPRALH